MSGLEDGSLAYLRAREFSPRERSNSVSPTAWRFDAGVDHDCTLKKGFCGSSLSLLKHGTRDFSRFFFILKHICQINR